MLRLFQTTNPAILHQYTALLGSIASRQLVQSLNKKDNRVDIHSIEDLAFWDNKYQMGNYTFRRKPREVIQKIMKQSLQVCAVMRAPKHDRNGQSHLMLPSTNLEQRYDRQGGGKRVICRQERFADQPSFKCATGVLIGKRTILTAGHLFYNNGKRLKDKDILNDYRFVFNYRHTNENRSLHTEAKTRYHKAEEVFWAKEVRLIRYNFTQDFALIELYKDVPWYDLKTINRHAPAAQKGQPLYMLGHGLGLPMKYSDEAKVQRMLTKDLYESNLDAFQGDSGAPVFSARNFHLTGILVGGQRDFTQYTEVGCVISRDPNNPANSFRKKAIEKVQRMDAINEEIKKLKIEIN
ncbi:trypsin-like serine protease [bacterium SCSIO 12741]|nr:trypsin-like serine protease [bacterium SCSIO 12741]